MDQVRFKVVEHGFIHRYPVLGRDGLALKRQQAIALEIPHHATRATVGQSRSVKLSDEFFEHPSRFFQADGLACIALVGLEVDIIKRHLDEFSRALGKAWSASGRWQLASRAWTSWEGAPSRSTCSRTLRIRRSIVMERSKSSSKCSKSTTTWLTVSQLLLEALLYRPASQASNCTRSLRHLTLKECHHLRGQGDEGLLRHGQQCPE